METSERCTIVLARVVRHFAHGTDKYFPVTSQWTASGDRYDAAKAREYAALLGSGDLVLLYPENQRDAIYHAERDVMNVFG
jgi:hypothetical protein